MSRHIRNDRDRVLLVVMVVVKTHVRRSAAPPTTAIEVRSSARNRRRPRAFAEKQEQPSRGDVAWAAGGSFATLLLAHRVESMSSAVMPSCVCIAGAPPPFILGTMGTLGVGLFATPTAQGMRLRSLVIGHLVSAAVVLCVVSLLGPTPLARAIAFAASLAFMMLFRAVHPPGGGLVVLLIDSDALRALGHWFLIWPGLGSALYVYACSRITMALRRACGSFVRSRQQHG